MNHERLKNIIRSANNIINRVESPDFKLDKSAIEERMAELKSNTEVPLMTAEQVQMMGGQVQQPQYHQPQYQPQYQPQSINTSNLPTNQQQALLEAEYNKMYQQMYGNATQQPVVTHTKVSNNHLNESAIKNSKLPDFVKDAMLKNPIQQLNPASIFQSSQSFSLEDVADIVNENTIQPQQIQQPRHGISVDEQTIRNIVREEVMEMMARYFGNTMNEDLEKKLIQKLIKEGKIKTVPKKKTN